jgi:hypothetical protein
MIPSSTVELQLEVKLYVSSSDRIDSRDRTVVGSPLVSSFEDRDTIDSASHS